jgi:hypothetical protein
MQYTLDLVVLPGSTEAVPNSASVTTKEGIFNYGVIFGPSRVNRANYLRIYLSGQQVYPNIASTAYEYYNYPIIIRDNLPMWPKENIWELRGWSVGARETHTYHMIINIMPFANQVKKVKTFG